MSASTETRALNGHTQAAQPSFSNQALQTAKLGVLYRESDAFYLVSLISALFCTLLLWSWLDPLALTAWLVLYSILAVGGIWLNKRFHRASRGERSDERWHRLFLLGALLTGSGWGLLSILLPWQTHPAVSNLILGFTLGLCIYAMSLYAVSLRIVLAFIMPALLPPLLSLLIEHEITQTALLPIFLLFLIIGTLRMRRFVLDSLTLSLRNQHLIDNLAQQKNQVETLNQELSEEIQTRRQAQQELQHNQQRLEDQVKERTQALADSNQRLQTEVEQRRQVSTELEQSRSRLSQAIEASNLGLWDWDLTSDAIYHSHFEHLFGRKLSEMPRFMGHLRPLVHADDYPALREAIIDTLKGRRSLYRQQFRIRHKSGYWRWLEDIGQVIERDDQGRALRMIGTRRDVTEERRRNEQLRLAWTVFDSSDEAIFVLDSHYHILSVNQTFSRLTGYTASEVFNTPITKLNEDTNSNHLYRHIAEALEQKGFWEGEVTGRRKDGTCYPQCLKIYRVRDEQQQSLHYVGLFSDISEHKHREEQLSYLANHDELTGLANRSLLTERLHYSVVEARQNNQLLVLLHVDLDRFKPINNTLGHHVGDKLLRMAAERLANCVPDANTVARLSGDEFMVLLDNLKNRQQINAVAETIIDNLRHPFIIDNHELLISASIGISLFPYHGRELQLLLNQADLARNKAKREGGSRYHYYSADLKSVSLALLNIEHDLRKAIERHEFVVFYQPKLCLHRLRITEVEALVRWRHPDKGLVPPGDFIPVAEESGLIGAIGEQVLEQACHQGRQWYDSGYPIKISVNLSAQQVRQGDMVKSIRQALTRSRLPVQYLELELTESLLMEDAEQTVKILEQLREMGLTIAIDDFGTGYSSLSYLRRFPIDVLKIDRSFIDEIEDDTHGGTITKAVIAMGHSLNMQVVGEGVETAEQLAFLQRQDCDFAQGYLISRPQPAEDITPLLDKSYDESVV